MTDQEYYGDLSTRRATQADTESIQRLIGEERIVAEKRYGNFDVSTLIETNYLSLAISDDNEDVVGFAVFNPEPGMDTADFAAQDWHAHVKNNYADEEDNSCKFNLNNTLWLTFFQAEPLMKDVIQQEMFEAVFEMFPAVDHILFSMKRLTPNFYPINAFKQEVPKKELKTELYSLYRQEYVRKMKIRPGRVEDNDDITPLLELSNLTTLAIEGEFWLSNKLHKQDETKKVLVAEVNQEVVGVTYITMCRRSPKELLSMYDVSDFDSLIVEDDYGEEYINALEIQMFFVRPEYKDRSIDFLNVAFNCFPKCNYAAIILPFTESDHPLLAPFVITNPHYDESCKAALHILSRESFYDTLDISAANANEGNAIVELLPQIWDEKTQAGVDDKKFIDQVTDSITNDASKCSTFVMRNQNNKILGVATIRDNFEELFLRNQYNIDEYINFDCYEAQYKNRCEMLNIYIDPVYVKHARTFIMAVQSLAKVQLMFYKPTMMPDAILDQFFVALTPRRHTETINDPMTPSHDYPVYFLTKRLISEPKTVIHSRIVVTGASKTGLSFMKTLVMIPYIHFTNIYIVSPDGLSKTNKLGSFFVGDTSDLKKSELLIALKRPNIKIVYDKLERIERQDKEIVCVSSDVIPYEYLILAISRFYSMPAAVTDASDFPEEGVVSLRNEQSFQEGMEQYISHILKTTNELSQIVIYGSNEDTFSTAHALVEYYNVPPSKITFVSPEGSSKMFADDRLERKMTMLLDSLGVTKYNFYCFEKFVANDEGQLKCVVISNAPELAAKKGKDQPNKKVYEVPCSLFINCHETNVDNNLLVTFAKMSLVFDGRLIVDPQFRTTDKLIYSAGPLAKFSRKFGVSEKMENSNSHELGKNMAYCVLKSLGIDEFYKTHIEPDLTLIQRVPTFHNKVKVLGRFLGHNNYFRVKMRSHKDEECMDMVTDFPLEDDSSKTFIKSRYTCMKINKFSGLISQITTFGPERIEINNLSCFVGLPLSYCNGLVKRYQEGLIKDLIGYFRENWALAIYCDRFKAFKSSIDLSQFPEINEFAEKNLEAVKNGSLYSILESHPSIRDIIKDDSKHAIQRALLQYLVEHQNREKTINDVYHIPSH